MDQSLVLNSLQCSLCTVLYQADVPPTPFSICHRLCEKLYRIAGNIGGNYIVRFHEKFTGFLFAELNIAFYCVHNVTPTHRSSFSAIEKVVYYMYFFFLFG